MTDPETRAERQTKMNQTVNEIRDLLTPYTPAEIFGILETSKLEIYAKVIKLANIPEGNNG